MVDEKTLHELKEEGVVSTEDGIRVIDASKLDPSKIAKKPKEKKATPIEEVHLPEPTPTPVSTAEEAPEKKVLLPPDMQKQELLSKQFEKKEFTMSEAEIPKGVGLDVGTSFLVAARFEKDGKINFRKIRDCFLELEPKSPINKKFIQKGLDDRKVPYIEKDGSFYVLGEDAFLLANERHINTRRPMHRGVLSPTEKEAFAILKELLKRIVGEPRIPNERLVFSVPAKPIDAEFDQLFHQDMLRSFLKSLGFDAHPMNEAEALAYSELLEEGLTGIALSCLVPGTKIYANYGIKNIEDVKIGDVVITHKGRPRKVVNVITKQFSGVKTKIAIQGYSDSTEDYQFVDNHELYVFRNAEWQWVGCEEILSGDLVGEPIVQQDLQQEKHTITICEKITSSPKTIKNHYRVSQDLYRLMGYFLGDGSVGKAEGCIQFDFHKNEKENIQDVKDILLEAFGKESAEIPKGPNVVRVKCYSRGLASWFANHCYNSADEKIFPWSLQRMSNGDCLNLLVGLIRADGVSNSERIEFFNTSSSLIWLAKQLFSRLGVPSSISYREPRFGGIIDGRQGMGTKIEWRVSAAGKRTFSSLSDFISNIDCKNSRISEKLVISGGFCCGTVQKIETEEYQGLVYDLQVEEDHSFSGPMLTISNCGAGMINVAVMSSGDPVVTFSTSRSGDWIDHQAAIATNSTNSIVQQEKESSDFDIANPDPNNQMHAALSVYYGNLLVYTLEQISYDLKRSPALPKFKEPIPLVVAGGTSLPKGFVEKFKQALAVVDMPVRISEVRHASDPLHAVANGLVLAASME